MGAIEDKQFFSFTKIAKDIFARNVIQFKDFGSTGNIPAAVDSTFDLVNIFGFPTLGFRVIPPTGGEVQFQGSFDDVNFSPITARRMSNDAYLQSTTLADNFIMSISSLKTIRFKVITGGSTTGTVIGRASSAMSVLEGIEHGNAPHSIGEIIDRRDASFSTSQTATPVWTPAAGKKFVITDYLLVISGNVDGRVTVFDETDVQGNRLINGFFDVSINAPLSIVSNLRTPFMASAADDILRLTSTTALDVDISLNGYEIF